MTDRLRTTLDLIARHRPRRDEPDAFVSIGDAAQRVLEHCKGKAGNMDAREEYLGDGLYASFDGYQLRLRAPRENGDHIVYLEPEILEAFLGYVSRLGKANAR